MPLSGSANNGSNQEGHAERKGWDQFSKGLHLLYLTVYELRSIHHHELQFRPIGAGMADKRTLFEADESPDGKAQKAFPGSILPSLLLGTRLLNVDDDRDLLFLRGTFLVGANRELRLGGDRLLARLRSSEHDRKDHAFFLPLLRVVLLQHAFSQLHAGGRSKLDDEGVVGIEVELTFAPKGEGGRRLLALFCSNRRRVDFELAGRECDAGNGADRDEAGDCFLHDKDLLICVGDESSTTSAYRRDQWMVSHLGNRSVGSGGTRCVQEERVAVLAMVR